MLKDALQQLPPTGPSGFEGLIKRLLEKLAGFSFYLAQSGTQSGRDMSSGHTSSTVIAVECKRYGDKTDLDINELAGKITQAVTTIESLDIWILVASRPVSDQLMSALEKVAEKLQIEVLVLSTEDGPPSTIELLCAYGAEIVLANLTAVIISIDPSLIADELKQVESHPEFARKIDHLRNLVTGGKSYGAARGRLRDWLLTHFSSDTGGRVAFGQVIDVHRKQAEKRLVPRAATGASLDQWLAEWPRSHNGLAVLGEEGDGKTWAVAEWLSEKLLEENSFPPVHWLPSHEAVDQTFDGLIGTSLAKRLGGSAENWLKRIRHWSKQATSSAPLLILVLDGLNERHDAQWWRPVIEELSAEPWRSTIAPIVTVRFGFWATWSRLHHIQWKDLAVPPFDDDELKVALHQAGVARDSLPEEILTLVRKPRYFDLALQHHDAVVGSGDITVARLIYEDWRDRYSRRTGLPPETDFHEVIVDLAKKHRQGVEKLEKRDLLDAASAVSSRDSVLRELETGGILIPEGRHWRVEPARLVLGFGLLLAEMVWEALNGNPMETLASFLEPQPAIDLKSNILEHAVLHSLGTPEFPTKLSVLLLTNWLTHRNRASSSEHSLSAYFPLGPSVYFDAAEVIWKDSTNDGWSEELLRTVFVRWSKSGGHSVDFGRAFRRWLGFVHVYGAPTGMEPREPGSGKHLIAAIDGTELALGPFEYAGIDLTAIEDDGLLRLGRLALSLISDGDRQPYVRALVAGYVTDALMQAPYRLELCTWIIRTSTVDLWNLFKPEIDSLIRFSTRAALQAAYRLFGSIGTAQALSLRAELPEDDLFPKSKRAHDIEADPCLSGISWGRVNCTICAERSDVPLHIMAYNLKECVKDPNLSISLPTRKRLLSYLIGRIKPRRIWSGAYGSGQKHEFEEAAAIVSACDPKAFAKLIRKIAREVLGREGIALQQLAEELLDFRIALTKVETQLIRRAWAKLRDCEELNEATERAEWALFELYIQKLSGEMQLDEFLGRPPSALSLTRFHASFHPVPWPDIERRLRQDPVPRKIFRALVFAAASPDILDERASRDLVEYAGSEESSVREAALRLIYLSGLKNTGAAAIARARQQDHVNASLQEKHWLNHLLVKWGIQLPFEELISKVDLISLGRAIGNRGYDVVEIEQYAELLDKALCEIGARHFDGKTLPAIELRASSGSCDYETEGPKIARSEFSRSETAVSLHWTWGGYRNVEISRDLFEGLADDDLSHRQEIVSRALAEQSEAGNHWFAERFSGACLKEICQIRPDLIVKWIGDPVGDSPFIVRCMKVARSFFETLCSVLLSVDPPRGVALYRFLKLHSSPVHFIRKGTDIPLLDFALFDAQYSDEVRGLWGAQLDEAKSDHDLLVLSILAQGESAGGWLQKRLANDLEFGSSFEKTRAVLLRGFVDSTEMPPEPKAMSKDVAEWQREQYGCALENWKANQWARTWFNRFLSARSDAGALAAFRLFLVSVDSRFTVWRNAAVIGLGDSRRRFFLASEHRVEQFSRINEKKHHGRFLGMRVAERQVWPWLGLD